VSSENGNSLFLRLICLIEFETDTVLFLINSKFSPEAKFRVNYYAAVSISLSKLYMLYSFYRRQFLPVPIVHRYHIVLW